MRRRCLGLIAFSFLVFTIHCAAGSKIIQIPVTRNGNGLDGWFIHPDTYNIGTAQTENSSSTVSRQVEVLPAQQVRTVYQPVTQDRTVYGYSTSGCRFFRSRNTYSNQRLFRPYRTYRTTRVVRTCPTTTTDRACPTSTTVKTYPKTTTTTTIKKYPKTIADTTTTVQSQSYTRPNNRPDSAATNRERSAANPQRIRRTDNTNTTVTPRTRPAVTTNSATTGQTVKIQQGRPTGPRNSAVKRSTP